MTEKNNLTILLVEDEIISAKAEKKILENYGYSVITAQNGETAINLVNTDYTINLILMDIDLGDGIDGTEAAEIILRNHDLPVVFCSNHTEPEIIEKTEKITSYGYISKSSSGTVFDASIKMALKLYDSRKQLQNKEFEYRCLFENSHSAVSLIEVIFDDNGNPIDYLILQVNSAFEKHTDYDASAFVNRRITEIMPGMVYNDLLTLYGDVIKTGISISIERYYEVSDRYFNITAYKYGENRVAVVSDNITERKHAEKKIRESEEKYRSLFENSSDAIVMYEAIMNENGEPVDFVLLEINSAFEKHTGLSSKDLLNRRVSENFPEIANSDAIALYGSVITTGKSISVERLHQSSQNYFNVNAFRTGENRCAVIMENITQRKIAETRISESEKSFRSLFENSLNSITLNEVIFDDNGNPVDYIILYANSAFEKHTGYNLSKILNKRATEAFPKIKNSGLIEIYGEVAKTGNNYSNEFYYEQTNRYFNVSAYKYGENHVAVVADNITERKLTEVSLRESEQRYRSLFENINEGIALHEIITDENNVPVDFIFLEVNRVYEQLTKLSSSDIIGKRGREVIPNIEQRWIDIYGRVAQTGESVYIEEYSEYLNSYWGVKAYSPKPNQFAVAMMNITERKFAEEKAEKDLHEKELIIKEIYHRIKNNISTIEGFLILQADTSTNDDVRNSLYAALTRIQSIRVLYNRLVIDNQYEEISVKSYIENLIESIVEVFGENKIITIEKIISDIILPPKKIMPVGIIINELITNIFKYAFRGRESGNISVIVQKNENQITIAIMDNGIGIDQSIDLDNISSFGIALVKMMAEQLDGTFTIINENGVQNIIRFSI